MKIKSHPFLQGLHSEILHSLLTSLNKKRKSMHFELICIKTNLSYEFHHHTSYACSSRYTALHVLSVCTLTWLTLTLFMPKQCFTWHVQKKCGQVCQQSSSRLVNKIVCMFHYFAYNLCFPAFPHWFEVKTRMKMSLTWSPATWHFWRIHQLEAQMHQQRSRPVLLCYRACCSSSSHWPKPPPRN